MYKQLSKQGYYRRSWCFPSKPLVEHFGEVRRLFANKTRLVESFYDENKYR